MTSSCESRLIVFRVDASLKIGSGHVMRCLTLAEALREWGFECHFICREHPGHALELVQNRGFVVHQLPSSSQNESEASTAPQVAHADWLGVTWEVDAAQCAEIVQRLAPHWLVVDHYALDVRWEARVKPAGSELLVIDDLADRQHKCTILLDHNALGTNAKQKYQSKVNNDCRFLLGPQYALLRPEYAALANALPERDGIIERVLVFVGGSDPYHLTECYLKALTKPGLTYLSVDVVIGKNHPSPDVVKELVNKRVKTRLYSGLPSLAALMVRADFMLGAGGTTNWERMCLGLNALVTSVADNQYEISLALEAEGLITFLGAASDLSIDMVVDAIHFTLGRKEFNKRCSNTSRQLVDGRGVKYVAQALIGG